MPDSNFLRFPDKFVWGMATSAYQIEGSWSGENRGESVWDNFCHQPRINYPRDHLLRVHRPIADGVPVSGYFAWSLLDGFEWNYRYRRRSGLVHVDYLTQTRTIKDSGHWYAQVCKANGFDPEAVYTPPAA